MTQFQTSESILMPLVVFLECLRPNKLILHTHFRIALCFVAGFHSIKLLSSPSSETVMPVPNCVTSNEVGMRMLGKYTVNYILMCHE